jgi:hypothetical protein
MNVEYGFLTFKKDQNLKIFNYFCAQKLKYCFCLEARRWGGEGGGRAGQGKGGGGVWGEK